MAVKVNLLKKSRVLSEKQYQIERRILLYSVFAFVLILSVTIGFFAWQVFVNIRLRDVEGKIAAAKTQLAGLESASTQQLYIKSRLQLIGTFLKGRAETREALQRVFSIPVPGVTVSAVTFEDSSSLKMQVVATSAKSFDQVYEYLENNREFFHHIVNDGVSRAQDGQYALSLILGMPQAQAKEKSQ